MDAHSAGISEKAVDSARIYKKVVQYVKDQIWHGYMKPGDRLPTERALAEKLNVSRNSVREGLRVLENIGVISSLQGSGNFISLNFDETMSEMLGFMYFLKGLEEDKVAEFRWMIEREALPLAIERITDEQKQTLIEAVEGLEAASTEDEQLMFDKRLHQTMVAASCNEFLISNYEALMSFMDQNILSMRQRIIKGMESRNMLEKSHRLLVEGLIEKDLQKSRLGLENHIGYTEKYKKYIS